MAVPNVSSLQIQQVSKVFPGLRGGKRVTAVDNVSLEVAKGEFLTLLGPSGCGKTTMLRLIAGFESPTTGTIRLNDVDITYQAPNQRDMSLVFQNYALFPHLSVYENVAYGLRLQRLPNSLIKEKINDILEQVDLLGLENRMPNELSGGQQQRVALARALVMEASVLLFDEPLSNLDAKLRLQMRSEIHALQRRLNITSIYVTHDQEEAMALSDRIVIMNHGVVEQMGSPEEIYRRPVSAFVASFIGQANFVTTKVLEVLGTQVKIRLFGQDLLVNNVGDFQVGEDVLVVLRPEGLHLVVDNSIAQVEVRQAMYLGATVEYKVFGNGEIITIVEADLHSKPLFAEGETAGLKIVPELIHLLRS